MIVELDIPFADTGVADLRFLPSAADLPVLASLECDELPTGGHLSLRLLGASHQAVLRMPDATFAETIACIADAGVPLPAQRTSTVGDWQFRLSVRVRRLPDAELSRECDRLRQHAEREDPQQTLLGCFPGVANALTYLRIRRRSHDKPPGWTTVHVYPESGEIVRTRTSLHRRVDQP